MDNLTWVVALAAKRMAMKRNKLVIREIGADDQECSK